MFWKADLKTAENHHQKSTSAVPGQQGPIKMWPVCPCRTNSEFCFLYTTSVVSDRRHSMEMDRKYEDSTWFCTTTSAVQQFWWRTKFQPPPNHCVLTPSEYRCPPTLTTWLKFHYFVSTEGIEQNVTAGLTVIPKGLQRCFQQCHDARANVWAKRTTSLVQITPGFQELFDPSIYLKYSSVCVVHKVVCEYSEVFAYCFFLICVAWWLGVDKPKPVATMLVISCVTDDIINAYR